MDRHCGAHTYSIFDAFFATQPAKYSEYIQALKERITHQVEPRKDQSLTRAAAGMINKSNLNSLSVTMVLLHRKSRT